MIVIRIRLSVLLNTIEVVRPGPALTLSTSYPEAGFHEVSVALPPEQWATTEPPPPNHAGVVNLYSREFYRLAARRLAPGGVITQWLPVFELSSSEARAMIAAFVAELPHTALLYGYKSGHELNNKLLRTLIADATAWQEVSFEDEREAPISYAHPAQAV